MPLNKTEKIIYPSHPGLEDFKAKGWIFSTVGNPFNIPDVAHRTWQGTDS